MPTVSGGRVVSHVHGTLARRRRVGKHLARAAASRPHPAFDAGGGLEQVLAHLDADMRQLVALA